MRLLLLPQVSLLLLAYFQGSTGQSRQKRQFGMVNPNDDVPFNFGNSFDGSQAIFERQKATLMREFELKLAELRANNRQELANAVMELKHQLTGLGRTLLLGQTQQGLLLSAAAAAAASARRNPEKEKEVITIATTTTENGDDQLHRTMLSKLEALHRNFTKLMNNYQSAAGHVAPLQFSNDKQKHQQQRDKQSQSKEAKKKKKQQKQQSKWDNDLELDESNFDDLDDDHYGLGNEAKSVKKSKPKKKVSKVLESPAVEQPPSLFDNYQRQPLSVVGRSMDEDKRNERGDGELQDQLSTSNNKYIYYLAAAGLAIFAYCCFAANSADNVNPMTKDQEMLRLEKRQREKAKRRMRRRRRSQRRHKKSEDNADEKEERPSSKNKRSKGRRQSQSRHSRESKSLSGGQTRHRGFSSSGTAGSLKQQPQQSQPVTNSIATGFTLHQMNNNTAAAGQLTGDEEGQVIVIEADQVRQFWGGGSGHSDMATRLEEMMDQSRFISQLIHHEQQQQQTEPVDNSQEQVGQEQQQQQLTTSSVPDTFSDPLNSFFEHNDTASATTSSPVITAPAVNSSTSEGNDGQQQQQE